MVCANRYEYCRRQLRRSEIFTHRFGFYRKERILIECRPGRFHPQPMLRGDGCSGYIIWIKLSESQMLVLGIDVCCGFRFLATLTSTSFACNPSILSSHASATLFLQETASLHRASSLVRAVDSISFLLAISSPCISLNKIVLGIEYTIMVCIDKRKYSGQLSTFQVWLDGPDSENLNPSRLHHPR